MLNFGLFWAPLIFSMFLPHSEFFGPIPTFSAVRRTFLADFFLGERGVVFLGEEGLFFFGGRG